MTDLAASIEAILFASGEPIPVARLSLVLNASEDSIYEAFTELNNCYSNNNHGIKGLILKDKLQICSVNEYADVIIKALEHRKPQQLSNPALETLAIIAYYQPVTQIYISKVRGVDSTYTISSLSDKGLIEEKGRLDAPGRPLLYGTTDNFLRVMNIKELSELPPLPDLGTNDGIEKLEKQLDELKITENNIIPVESVSENI